MFHYPILHLIFSFVLTCMSIIIFADIDEVEYKPEKRFTVSDRMNTYFKIEFALTGIIAITSLLDGNLILLFLSSPITLYNVYSSFTGNYKLFFAIGDEKANNRNYQSQSLRYKIKFVLYAIITMVSMLTLVFSMVFYFAERFLRDAGAVSKIIHFLGIF